MNKKGNQFVFSNFGDVQFFSIMNILGGTTSLVSFFRASKTSKTKGFFPMNGSTVHKKRITLNPPPRRIFQQTSKREPLEKDSSDYQKILSCRLMTEKTLSKMMLSKPLPSGEENYQYLLDIWKHENMCTFKDLLRWYNNKIVVPTPEAMQKRLVFYQKKGIDMLKIGCTIPNLANIFLH